ncbi:hypothetical protein LEN26_015386 [Aphanomyces euteiches]|nr:hypothetical protein LEN26_015386 [Aphanomyces euteiches]KAH9115775.1 hypothetical protein AeMF1_010220 [Aphanomyces euteiches]KAH9197058.1 hypothetical protein AeNC1_000956 [Aphanomyces euteiches]
MVVGVFLRQDAADGTPIGLRKASDTCVRLEPSVMSPGVASINFDAVVENAPNLFDRLVQPMLSHVSQGRNVSVISAGCRGSGKSQLMHGSNIGNDSNNNTSVGIIERCLQSIFENERTAFEQDSTRMSYIELQCVWLSDKQVSDNDLSPTLFYPVRTLDDALRHYKSHMESDRQDNAHCIVTCRVQSTSQADPTVLSSSSRSVLVGTLVCLDIFGAAMMALPSSASPPLMDYLPTSAALSTSYSSCLSSSFIPCLLVGLRTQAEFQQHAIHALLYACRVKDMTAIPSPNLDILSMLGSTNSSHDHRDFLRRHLPKINYAPGSDGSRAVESCMRQLFIKQQASLPPPSISPPTSPIMTTSSSEDDDDENLKKLQPTAAATSTPSVSRYDQALQALAAEKALTERCASRISRLNECIKVQRAAHDKLQAEKQDAERRLAASEEKLQHVQAIVDALQSDVNRLKRKEANPSALMATSPLVQFSSRLTKVIDETKQVVAMKDQFIQELEDSTKKTRADLETYQSKCRHLEALLEDEQKARKKTQARVQILENEAACRQTDQIESQRVMERWKAEMDALSTANRQLQDELNAVRNRQTEMERKGQEALNAYKLESKMELDAQIRQMEEKAQAALQNEQQRWRTKLQEVQLALDAQVRAEASQGKLIEALKTQIAQLEGDLASWKTQAQDLSQEKTALQIQLAALEVAASTAVTTTANSPQADEMIQAMIHEVEVARRRETHLVQALAVANQHESSVKAQKEALEKAMQALRRENMELCWALDRADHRERNMEQAQWRQPSY